MTRKGRLYRTVPARTGTQLALGLAFALTGCAHHHHRDRALSAYQTSRLTEYHDRYHNPLLSPGAQFAALPPAVQRTIRAEAGAGDIDDILKETDGGRIVYRIYFSNPKAYPPLYVAPDGTMLNPDLTVAVGAAEDSVGLLTGGPVTGITLSDLPPQVMKTIQERAPDAEVAYINKDTHDNQTQYLIVFKDQLHPAIRIAANGTLLSGGGAVGTTVIQKPK